MRRSFVTVLLGAAFAFGCSSSDGPTTTCGDNTQSVNGVCETLVTCGEGTTLVNNICQPEAGAGACAEGTQTFLDEDGVTRCVPAAEACDEGTRFVDEECVPDFEVVCGSGTDDEDGVCVLELDLECGPGTEQVDETADDGVTVVAQCEPLCEGDQLWDEVAEACVDACVDGAEFDEGTNTCRALCADDQFYSGTIDGCVDVPLCLRNTTDTNGDGPGGDCAGWPFNELSLETFCARRAFNICDPIFDPACSCEHAGDYLGGNRDAGTLSDNFPEDYASCVMEEITICDVFLGAAFLRALEGEGQITVDSVALAGLDDSFLLEEGLCTRPSDFEPLPIDDLVDAIDGTVGTDEPCFHDLACADDHQCRFPEDDFVERGLEPLIDAICQPRAAIGEDCNLSGGIIIDRGGVPVPIGGDPTSAIKCQDELLCLFNPEVERSQCQPPRVLGAACNNDGECSEGLFCFPADLDAITGPSYVFQNPSTCQAPQSEGVGCLADTRFVGGVRVFEDVCQSNLRCDDSARSADNDGVGQCVAAVGSGQPCSYCDEYGSGIALGGNEIDNFLQNPFTVCGGELQCTFEQLTEGFSQTCESTVSVCPPRLLEVEGLGGVCNPYEFVCDDSLDEDGDEAVDCDDRDCQFSPFTEVCNCEDEIDNDGDGDQDCDDSDCAAVDACL